MYTSTITNDWRTTIPQPIVEKFNLSEGDTILWMVEDDHVILKFVKEED